MIAPLVAGLNDRRDFHPLEEVGVLMQKRHLENGGFCRVNCSMAFVRCALMNTIFSLYRKKEMKYFVHVSRLKEGEYLASFPELEGCLSEGKTLEEAKKNASEALNGWLASHCDRNLDIPNPKSRKGKNYYPITVDLQITLAIVLRKKRRKKKWTQSQAARKLGITQQAYARLEIPTRANPSLVTLKKLSEALELDIEFSYDLAA